MLVELCVEGVHRSLVGPDIALVSRPISSIVNHVSGDMKNRQSKQSSHMTYCLDKVKKKYLLLEEFECDLGHDALELPAWRLVQLLDLFCTFGLSLKFSPKVSLQDLGEKSNPWCHLTRLQKVWTHL